MQKSKSTVSFAPTFEHTEFARRTRSRRRSSLDTFVIPGRTRLPSSKSSQDATDIQVAEALLDHSLLLQQSKQQNSSDMMAATSFPERGLPSRNSSSEYSNYQHSMNHDISREPPPPWARGPGIDPRLQPRSHRHAPEVIAIPPHRRTQTTVPQMKPRMFVATSEATDLEPTYSKWYDGATDRSDKAPVSRMTSMTWSTVSQRVLSNSSGSSHASRASEFKHEYNELAERHGLPPMTGESEGTLFFATYVNTLTNIRDFARGG